MNANKGGRGIARRSEPAQLTRFMLADLLKVYPQLEGARVASAIADKDDRYRLFAAFGLTPTGGPVGVAAAQLTYWAYQLRDGLRGRLTGGRQSP